MNTTGAAGTGAVAPLVGHDGTTALWDELWGLDRAGLVRRYRAAVGWFDSRVFELSDEHLDQAFVPEAGVGRWPVRVLLGHLADADLVYAHRVRRAVAQPGAVLSLWDEHAWIDAGLYAPPGEGSPNGAAPPVGAFVAAVHTLRQWMGEWLGSLGEEAWGRSVLHPERGPLDVRALVVGSSWHVEHHAWYLNAKVARFLGAKEACEPEGCGSPACACKGGE